jgi:hypothetical protein
MSKTNQDPTIKAATVAPLTDFMGFEEAATHLPGMTVLSFKKMIERESGPLADGIRDCVYEASPRRHWIKRHKFMEFIRSIAS